VVAATHSTESAQKMGGEPFQVLAADIADRVALGRLTELRGVDVVVHCASSGRGGAEDYQRVYLEGVRALHFMLGPRQIIFTSSTSVYAQNDGAIVTEDSPAEPVRETGKVLRAAEEFVLARGGTVARLAGIYGPGRSVLLRKFLSGEAVIEGEGVRVVNQVHRDDAAAALLALAGQPGVFNVSDDTPLTQREVYAWLASHFERPLPPTGPVDVNRKRGVTSKRVSNAKLRALGWMPQFASFREAIQSDGSVAPAS